MAKLLPPVCDSVLLECKVFAFNTLQRSFEMGTNIISRLMEFSCCIAFGSHFVRLSGAPCPESQ